MNECDRSLMEISCDCDHHLRLSYARRETEASSTLDTHCWWPINHPKYYQPSAVLMREEFFFYYFGFNKSDFCFYDRYYDFHVLIFSHSSTFSLLYFSPYPVRIIFLRSKIIIIAAPKVLMVSETKRLKVMIRPRRRVSFTEVDIWIILIFFWHVRERDFRLRC